MEKRKLLVLSDVKPRRFSTMLEALTMDWDIDLELFGECGLKAMMTKLDFCAFDRVLFAANVRKAGAAFLALRNIPQLHIFDLDLQQDYLPESKYYRSFPALFKKFKKLHLIVTSHASLLHYQRLGFSVSWLPKAYDHRLINNLGLVRNLQFGFVGRTKNRIYRRRNKLLSEISARIPLQILRTEDASEANDEYNRVLNRIRYFISADVGFKEFHIKNFEAMAAGCVVCAYKTSDEEAAQLGFEDMKNIILYRTSCELEAKIREVETAPMRWSAMSAAATRIALDRHQWRHRKACLSNALNYDGQPPPRLSFTDPFYEFRARARNLFSGR